jgi:hypothetical protein
LVLVREVDVNERQMAELWSWRLAAGLASAIAIRLLIETHAGGGQNDTLEILLGRESTSVLDSGPRVACNRLGRVHLLGVENGPEPRDLIRDMQHGLPIEDVVEWLRQSAATSGDPDPKFACSVRLMARMLGVAIGDGEHGCEWRNGYSDTSGGESGRRSDLFDAVPAAATGCVNRESDLLGVPEYRFWFLIADDIPKLAVEPNAGRIYIGDATLAVEASDAFERCLGAIGIRLPDETVGAAPARRVARARSLFWPVAERLAREMIPDPVPFRPGRNLTEMAVWFTDESDGTLVVEVGSHEAIDSLDQVLAYALAWQGDRDLVLVLPETHAEQTMTRLPWIETCVRVFVYGPELLPRPAIVPARAEVLSKAKTLGIRRTKEHTLGDAAELVEPLVKWADEHWALKEAHRGTCQAI